MNTDTPSTSSITTRKPKPQYLGQNGFVRGPIQPDEIPVLNLAEAQERHARAVYVIENKGRPVPDFETMQAEIDSIDDLSTVKDRLAALQAEHLEDLKRLYDSHAGEYALEALDRYHSKDEFPVTGAEAVEKLRELYTSTLKDTPLQLSFSSAYEHLRYTYLSRLLPLQEEHARLEKDEADMQRRRQQMFPLSKEEFFSSEKPPDVRLRAARFLVADKTRQEKMLVEYGWAWRQVKPLQDIFVKDEAFSAEVRSLLISATSVRDPRKRVMP